MHRSRLLHLVVAIACTLTPPATLAQVRLPALGESASDDLSVSAERRLGLQIMREVRRDPAYLDDPTLLDYVQSLWQPMVAAARQLGHIGADIDSAFAWEIFLVKDPSVNAFALPGGNVGIHLGLIAGSATRDEIGSVMAHELSHVTQRHIARQIGNSQRTSMVGAAAMILALIAASRSGNSEVAQAAIVGGQASIVQGQLNFSRDAEREADRVGFSILLGAGFRAEGMATMFEKLQTANRLNDSGAFPYLRSHPLTSERISEARARVTEGAVGTPAASDGVSVLHAMMAARAQILADPSVASLRRWQVESPADASRAQRSSRIYGMALASSLLNDHEAAQRAVERGHRWLDEAPRDIKAQHAMHWLEVEVRLAAKSVDATFMRDLPRGLHARAELLLSARIAQAVSGAQPDALQRAVEALQLWTAEHPADALAWSELAQCAELTGRPLQAARARAEARAASGDTSGAINILRGAQQQFKSGDAADRIDIQVIDARARSLVESRRQEREGTPGQD